MFKSLLLVMSGLPYSVFGTDQFLASLMEFGCGYSDTWGSHCFSLRCKSSPQKLPSVPLTLL